MVLSYSVTFFDYDNGKELSYLPFLICRMFTFGLSHFEGRILDLILTVRYIIFCLTR